MEPLKPSTAMSIMANAAPSASPQDLAEYERLLSARYRKDPSVPAISSLAASSDDGDAADETRLQQLEKKLFPKP